MSLEFWTKDRELLIRQMWEDGKSSSEIGAVIGCTRNAVIGKARRLHLTPRTPRQRPKTVSSSKPKDKKNGNGHTKPPVPVSRPALMSRKTGIGILDLNSQTCRQVIGVGKDGLAIYCGKQVKIHSWCCEDHYGINYYQGK